MFIYGISKDVIIFRRPTSLGFLGQCAKILFALAQQMNITYKQSNLGV